MSIMTETLIQALVTIAILFFLFVGIYLPTIYYKERKEHKRTLDKLRRENQRLSIMYDSYKSLIERVLQKDRSRDSTT